MTIKWQTAALLLVAAGLLGFLLAQGTRTDSNRSIRERELVRIRPDTALAVAQVPLRPLRLRTAANHVRTRTIHDTLYREACLDTLLTTDSSASGPDTLSVCYARKVFALFLGLAPRRRLVAVPYLARDTFYWREDSIRVAQGTGRAWYADALLVIISLAAGILFGKL
ncbi:MAG: hypothetical protein ACYDBH_23390 [Acidobacteriaceae bacterium]